MGKTSFEKSKIRFLLLEGIHQSAIETLNREGYHNIELIPGALDTVQLKQKISQAHFIGIRSRTQLDDTILEQAQKLIAIGCFCIGTNQVDLTAALRQGIPVFNAPYSNTRSVAELVLAEAIMLLRGIPAKNADAHAGIWQKSAANAYEIRGKTLGIIGYGNIGTQLGILAEALGMIVRFYDVETKLPMGNAEQIRSLKDLLANSDVVSLHVPENELTANMINAETLAQMKAHSVLINASRGSVVDIEALSQYLANGHLLGAAIDVFPQEPKTNQEQFESPLRRFNNVILTPHVGGSTIEAQFNIGVEVAEKLAKYSDNGTTTTSVNFPEVALPAHPSKHRLLHIHQNIPGVLSEINQIFSEHQVNIAAQYLQTNEKIGYVVSDVDAAQSETALRALQSVRGTIKSRVLF